MKADWVFMPHAGHFILGNRCEFRLNTAVANGKYIVSTVGEYMPDDPVREINAESRGVALKGMGDEREHDYRQRVGFEEIGYGRTYETMVFHAKPNGLEDKYKCCPFLVKDFTEIDAIGANDASTAAENHFAMCNKWSKP